MHLSNLKDDELTRLAYAEHDALTATDMQTELLRRFDLAQPRIAALDELEAQLEDTHFESCDLPKLCALLSESNVYSVDDLREKLQRAHDFYDIAQEAGDVFTRMAGLVSNTL